MKGIAVFQNRLNGYVTFKQDNKDSPVKISGHINKLAPGKHGIHIHVYGNLLKSDCMNCGGHWNPTGVDHGSRTSENSHAGDFGNITANDEKESKFYFITSKITLYGENSVIGRSLVIHEDEDDLGLGGYPDSLTTGHSGKRLDCAVIGIDKE